MEEWEKKADEAFRHTMEFRIINATFDEFGNISWLHASCKGKEQSLYPLPEKKEE